MGLLKGILAATFIGAVTVGVCMPLFVAGLVRPALPKPLRSALSRRMDWIIDAWVGSNRWLIQTLALTDVNITWEDAESLSRDHWYMVVSNHQSWSDILLLQTNLFGHIPPLKFFTKQQLLWIPFLGTAMWLLGFPYVKRVSKSQISKNPKLKGGDKRATLKACEGFKNHPTSVLNFLEGTRFTPAKHANQRTKFRHLLKPRVGGLGYVLGGLNDRLHKMVDVTIIYPEGTPSFWQFLKGECLRVDMLIQCRDIPEPIRFFESDREQRRSLGPWIDGMWQEKDDRLPPYRELPA